MDPKAKSVGKVVVNIDLYKCKFAMNLKDQGKESQNENPIRESHGSLYFS